MRRIAILAAAIGCTIGAGQASAHAFLKTATPAVGSTVPAPPQQVEITFTEGIEPSFSTIEVKDASGKRVDRGNVAAVPGSDRRLVVGLNPLPPGTYKVTWHATATDTHKTQGSFIFTVAH